VRGGFGSGGFFALIAALSSLAAGTGTAALALADIAGLKNCVDIMAGAVALYSSLLGGQAPWRTTFKTEVPGPSCRGEWDRWGCPRSSGGATSARFWSSAAFCARRARLALSARPCRFRTLFDRRSTPAWYSRSLRDSGLVSWMAAQPANESLDSESPAQADHAARRSPTTRPETREFQPVGSVAEVPRRSGNPRAVKPPDDDAVPSDPATAATVPRLLGRP